MSCACASAEEDEVISEQTEAFVELRKTLQCIITSVVEYPQVAFLLKKKKKKTDSCTASNVWFFSPASPCRINFLFASSLDC